MGLSSPSPDSWAPPATPHGQAKEKETRWVDILNRELIQLAQKRITRQRDKKQLNLLTYVFGHHILQRWDAAFFTHHLTFQTVTYLVQRIITMATTTKNFNRTEHFFFIFSFGASMCWGTRCAFETGKGRSQLLHGRLVCRVYTDILVCSLLYVGL